MDTNGSIIMPESTFAELSEAAWNQTPATVSERIVGTAQTTIVCAVLAGSFTAACWGWAKATDWVEERRLQRKMTERKSEGF